MARQTKIYGLTEMILIGPFPGIHKHWSFLSQILKFGWLKLFVELYLNIAQNLMFLNYTVINLIQKEERNNKLRYYIYQNVKYNTGIYQFRPEWLQICGLGI